MADIMDGVLRSKVGEDERVRVVFKKTVNTAQYETEVFEADTEVDVVKGITGIEREIIIHSAFASLEYGVMLKLVLKGNVTKQDMDKVVEQNEKSLKLLFNKADSLGITGMREKYAVGVEFK